MRLTGAETRELARLEHEFEAAGGRGVELANRIDELRTKRDSQLMNVTVRLQVAIAPDTDPGKVSAPLIDHYLHEMLDIDPDLDVLSSDPWRITEITVEAPQLTIEEET